MKRWLIDKWEHSLRAWAILSNDVVANMCLLFLFGYGLSFIIESSWVGVPIVLATSFLWNKYMMYWEMPKGC